MLIRIVRMTIDPQETEAFLDHFDAAAPQIRSFPGCHHLELWRDADAPHVCTTYSHWTNSEALEAYRESDLFQSTWASVKPLFASRPHAHSYFVARPATDIDRAANEVTTGNS